MLGDAHDPSICLQQKLSKSCLEKTQGGTSASAQARACQINLCCCEVAPFELLYTHGHLHEMQVWPCDITGQTSNRSCRGKRSTHCLSCLITLGLAHAANGNLGAAAKAYIAAMRRNTSLSEAYFYLAVVCARSCRPLEAALLHLMYANKAAMRSHARPISLGGRQWAKALHRAFLVFAVPLEVVPEPDQRPFWWDEPELQLACRERLAIGLQALWRGCLSKRRCTMYRMATAKLQAATRLYALRRCVRRRAAAAVTVQSMARARAAKSEVKVRAAAEAQAAVERLAKAVAAATRLQSWFRASRCYKPWPMQRQRLLAGLVSRHRALLAERRALEAKVASGESRALELNERLQEAGATALRDAGKLQQLVAERQREAKDLAAMVRRQAAAHGSDQRDLRASVAAERSAKVAALTELEEAKSVAEAERQMRQELQLELSNAQETVARVMDETQEAIRQSAVAAEQETLRASNAVRDLARLRLDQDDLASLSLAELHQLQRDNMERHLRLIEACEARRAATNPSTFDQFACTICMDEPKDTLLQPCGHVTLCSQCAGKVDECPLCRAHIVQRLKAHL